MRSGKKRRGKGENVQLTRTVENNYILFNIYIYTYIYIYKCFAKVVFVCVAK